MDMMRSFIFIGVFWGSIAGSDLDNSSTLISHPREILGTIKSINREFERERYEQNEDFIAHHQGGHDGHIDEFIQRNVKLLDDYEKRSPLFLLGECTYEGFCDCCLSRLDSPHLRQGLETYVTHMIDERMHHSKGRALQYVSFGSGGMFQDLVILAKTLQKHPQAHFDVHLIDAQYNIYTDSCELMGESMYQVDCQTKPFQSVLDKLVVQARTMGGDDTDEKLPYKLASCYIGVERMAQQFLHYLKSNFPEAHLSLFLHKSSDDYLTYVRSQKKAYPDIIVASDITDEMSLLRGGNEVYKQLVIESLKHNPENVNVVLDRTACGSLISYYPKSARTHISMNYKLRSELTKRATTPMRRLINSKLVLSIICRRFWKVPSHANVSCYAIPLAR